MRQPYEIVREKFVSPELCPPLTRERACSGNEIGTEADTIKGTVSQNRDYNRSPTSVGTFDVNGAAHVASRMLAAILLASKNGDFDRVLLGSSLQKLDYQ